METVSEVAKQLSTLRDYLRWAVSKFTQSGVYFGHGTDNALDEALQLVLHTVGVPLGSEEHLLDATITQEERKLLLTVIDARCRERIPVPYLTGLAWFAGLRFKVDERVLIPRSPIAELIEQGFEPWLAGRPVKRLLDLCTGGGCIGIACAHYFEEAAVELADLSADALVVAQSNIDEYELNYRVTAIQSDLFSELSGEYDLIVSNPPYVDLEDVSSMPAEYQHEPAMALGSGDDGLDISRRILREAANYLSDDGLLVVEVGNSCVALEHAYPTVPFTWVEFERGGHGVFVFTKAELQHYSSEFAAGSDA
ncbi:50S ribosomal protein L3 N(5)-glutamine methyltransferase [Dasania sp. GY-MA-18]|uniref:Ribosomal protein uL3 glutamine methyltransferase n=1 Tax=Dasania phycosphaerae TaxID=2950436 RepID=A0A9J6RKR7_9GAMM|nr:MULTISPECIES: 50S ribosomal protein L3 N(5)-glutamine methyltransferase [Dasania]MCR8922565.1 50S ribosomal protein L3 N(5)-glutamine methyltransferase [Dasania sp. GY-MA-18]MCZ0864994.1 50S ribosomal protein L3 N(5)-glutamine methyltransferase [Dasania phycosphaerae]MCZ0868721.1 50S ribosomal protein L3 N(5)-glutamine methyltransferase [Dasania phycosphaerae]